MGTFAGASEHPSLKTGLLTIDSIATTQDFNFSVAYFIPRTTLQEVFIWGSDLHRTKQGSWLPCERVQDSKFTHINAIWHHDYYRLQQKFTAAAVSIFDLLLMELFLLQTTSKMMFHVHSQWLASAKEQITLILKVGESEEHKLSEVLYPETALQYCPVEAWACGGTM